jgi:hypothetical protein
MKGNSGRGHELLMECLVLNLYMKMGMFLTSRQIEAAVLLQPFHEKRRTIMDQNISRQTNY